MKFLATFLFIAIPRLSFAEHCTPRVQSCGYYLCEEKNHHCGPKGYPLGFGFRFCQVFLNTEKSYSPEAQTWLRKVRVCLMKKFQEANAYEERTCREIKTISFRSHVGCYVSTGYCHLKANDKFQIFWALRTSLIYPEVFHDAYAVTQVCSSRITPNQEALSARR
jgi:hypothetical protein